MPSSTLQMTQQSTFETSHTGPLHDAQLDYYGKLLASASADHTVHLWDVASFTNEAPKFVSALRGHDGPVWQVSWAHPKFGNLLASCSYDRKVIIWKGQLSSWSPIYISEDHTGSVDSIQFSPWEFGLHLACGSSDGTVSILSYNTETGTWSRDAFTAHPNGVLCVSWCPLNPTSVTSSSISSSSSTSPTTPQPVTAVKRLATGGADHQVRVWNFADATNKWVLAHQMGSSGDSRHSRWVRDVAWRPDSGLSPNLIASCSDDGTVIVWQETDSHTWKCKQVINLNGPVWRVAWAVTGAVLSIASGTNTVSLYKENLQGVWEPLAALNEVNTSSLAADAGTETTRQQQSYGGNVDLSARGLHDVGMMNGDHNAGQQQQVLDGACSTRHTHHDYAGLQAAASLQDSGAYQVGGGQYQHLPLSPPQPSLWAPQPVAQQRHDLPFASQPQSPRHQVGLPPQQPFLQGPSSYPNQLPPYSRFTPQQPGTLSQPPPQHY